MNREEYENIASISFPNTVADQDAGWYNSPDHSFQLIMEAGEMAGIAWIGVYKDGKKVAQIRQSVCNVYFS